MSVSDAFRERLGDRAESATATFARWATEPGFSRWHALLEAMGTEGHYDELADAFSRVLPFGTGGRRGPVGVGPNRMNPWTLGTSIEGHVRFLRARFGSGPLEVVLTYDVRSFHDQRERYPHVPSPLDGLTSRSLAELAARIYAAHGVVSWIQPREDGSFLATPELSFLIRHLKARGGLNISASHNPPDDNGAKVYDETGAQLVPPEDQALLDEVATIQSYTALPWEEAKQHVRWLGTEHHQAYVDAVLQDAPSVSSDLVVAYTSLHGVGRIHEIVRGAGFDTTWVASQAAPDGRFPTVPAGVANPENPAVFEVALAESQDAELVLATDPDADRIGCMVRHEGSWQFLDGNQIAAVVVDAVLRRWSDEGTALVVKTEVTSSLVSRLADRHGAVCRGDLLVGFKYIASVMNALAEEGPRFAVGCEESHGLLVGEAMRDKDAGGGGLWIAIAAADAKARGVTLVDVLADFDREIGAVRTTQVRKTFEGVVGRRELAALLDGLRASPPTEIGGRAVVGMVDHRDPKGRHGPILSESDAASRNVISFVLAGMKGDDGARMIWRPSGTEPKLKVYLEVSAPPSFPPKELDQRLAGLRAVVGALLASEAS